MPLKDGLTACGPSPSPPPFLRNMPDLEHELRGVHADELVGVRG